jgi:hypothetical protein
MRAAILRTRPYGTTCTGVQAANNEVSYYDKRFCEVIIHDTVKINALITP